MGRKFPQDFKERAVRLTDEHRKAHDCSAWQAATVVGERLGVSPHTIRGWMQKSLEKTPPGDDLPFEVREEMQQLRSENLELRRANEILKAASAFFARELDQPGR
ncbi:transposase [Corynebacterium diphtheriae]|nr:transposase [Corynebacterium diphtheriae]